MAFKDYKVIRQARLIAAAQGISTAGRSTGEWWQSLDPTTQARLVQGTTTLTAQILARRQAGQQLTPQEIEFVAPPAPPAPAATPPWLPVAILGGAGLLAVILLTARR